MDDSVHIDVTIEGVTPLLCNRFTDEAQLKASAGSSSAFNTGDSGTPREQAEPKLYVHEGVIGIPQPNLLRCIIDAGKYFKSGRSKITTQKSSIIPSSVDIMGVHLPLRFETPWEVDTRPIRNPATGGRRLAHRPMFNDWALDITVELDTELINAKLFREIVDVAGKRIGLGDFRPDNKGPFGKFVVTAWEIKKNGE